MKCVTQSVNKLNFKKEVIEMYKKLMGLLVIMFAFIIMSSVTVFGCQPDEGADYCDYHCADLYAIISQFNSYSQQPPRFNSHLV